MNKGTNKAVTVLHIILCALLMPIILLNITIIISSYLYPNEIPGAFGIKPVAVLSGSMEDTFHEGDLIFIKKAAKPSYQIGDVICFLDSDQAVTHRIAQVVTGKNGTVSYLTKGDANPANDQNLVYSEQIQGLWTGVSLANMGNFVMFLSTTTGMIVFVVGPIVLLIGWDILRRTRQDRTEKRKMRELESQLKELKSRYEEEKDKSEK